MSASAAMRAMSASLGRDEPVHGRDALGHLGLPGGGDLLLRGGRPGPRHLGRDPRVRFLRFLLSDRDLAVDLGHLDRLLAIDLEALEIPVAKDPRFVEPPFRRDPGALDLLPGRDLRLLGGLALRDLL